MLSAFPKMKLADKPTDITFQSWVRFIGSVLSKNPQCTTCCLLSELLALESSAVRGQNLPCVTTLKAKSSDWQHSITSSWETDSLSTGYLLLLVTEPDGPLQCPREVTAGPCRVPKERNESIILWHDEGLLPITQPPGQSTTPCQLSETAPFQSWGLAV